MSAVLTGVFRLGRDADVKKGRSEWVSYSLAYDFWDGRSKSQKTQWVNVSAFGDRALNSAHRFTKGSLVFATIGDLRVEEWQRADGGLGVTLAGSLVGELRFAPSRRETAAEFTFDIDAQPESPASIPSTAVPKPMAEAIADGLATTIETPARAAPEPYSTTVYNAIAPKPWEEPPF